jgi:hypothetical protein
MEGAITSETSVNLYQTTMLNNPEDSYLHTRRLENLKSQSMMYVYECITLRSLMVVRSDSVHIRYEVELPFYVFFNDDDDDNNNNEWHYSPDGRKPWLIRFRSLSRCE